MTLSLESLGGNTQLKDNMKNYWLNLKQIEVHKYVLERLNSLYSTVPLGDESINMVISFIRTKLNQTGKQYSDKCFREGVFRKSHMVLLYVKLSCGKLDTKARQRYQLAKEEYENWESKI